MASDAYKGLTIKLGGDTTELNSALKSAKQAASDVQYQLKQVNQALKMDPDSLTSVKQKIELLGDASGDWQKQLNLNEQAIEELKESAVDLGTGATTIGELADSTDNAALAAKTALDRYNKVDEAIAECYNEVGSFSEAVGISADQLRDMGSEELDQTLDTLVEMGVITPELSQKLKTLRSAWDDASEGLDAAKQVEKLQQLETECVNLKAKIKDAGAQMAELGVPTELTSDFNSAMASVDSFKSSVEESKTRIKELDKSLKLDSSNVELADEKLSLLSDQTKAANEEAEQLKSLLAEYSAKGVDTAGQSMEELAEATREAAEEYNEANARVDALGAELEELKTKQAIYKASVDETSDSYDENARKLEETEAAIEATSDSLDEWRRKAEEASDAFDAASMAQEMGTVENAIDEVNDQQKELNDLAKQTGSIFQSSGTLVKKTLSQIDLSSYTTWSSLREFFQQYEQYVTNNLVNAFEKCIEEADELDSAFRDMKKTVDGTEEEFEDLKEAALDYSTTHVTSAEQILEIEELGGQLGIAAEDLEDFATVTSNLSIATDLEADEAATDLGQLINVLDDLSVDNVDQFSDALVRLGNNGASTETEIADIATRIGSTASTMGLTAPQILAWSSTLASTGQTAETAGTALTNTMTDIEVAVADGGEELDLFAEIADMSAEEFADAWTNEPSAALEAFVQGLATMEDENESSVAALEDLGITSVRQLQSLENLAGSIGLLDDNLQMSEDAWNGVSDEWGNAGDAAYEAEQKSEGLSGAISLIENSLSVLASEIGDTLTPVFQAIAEILPGLVESFSDIDDGTQTAIIAFAGLAAVVGPLGTAISSLGAGGLNPLVETLSGPLVKGLESGISNTKLFTKHTKLSTVAMKAAKTASKLLATAGIFLVVDILIQAISAFAEYREKMETVEKATEGLLEVTDHTSESADTLVDSLTDYGSSADSLRDEIDDLYESSAELADQIEETWETAYSEAGSIASARGAVEEYAGATGLTQTEIAELKSSVDTLNTALGTSYEVMQDGDAWVVVEEGCEDVEGAADEAKEAILELADAAIWETLTSAAEENLEGLYNQLSADNTLYIDAEIEYESALSEWETACSEAGMSAESTWDDIQTAFEDGLISLNDYQDLEVLWDAVDESGEAVDELAAKVESSEQAYDQELEYLSELEVAASDTSGSIAGELGSAFEALYKTVQAGGGTWEDFETQLEIAGANVDQLKDLSQTDLVDLAASWDGTFAGLTSVLDEWGIDCSSTGAQAVSAIAQGVSDGSIDVETEMDVIKAMITGDWEGTYDLVSETSAYIPQVLADALQNGEITVDESMVNLIGSMIAEMDTESIEAAAEELGFEVPAGMIEGLENGDDPSEWVDAICEALIEAGYDTLDVGSPSKVFATLGDYLVQGLEEGITGSTAGKTAVTAVQTLVQGMIDTATESLSGFGTTISNTLTNGTATLPATMYSIGSTAGQNFATGISLKTSVAQTAVTVMVNSAANGVGTTFSDKMSSVGSTGGSGFVSGIRNYYSPSKTAGTTIGKKVWNGGLGTFRDKMEAVGKKGGAGLVSGIGEKEDAAKTAGEDLGKKVWKAGLSDFNDKMKDAGKKGAGKFVSGMKDSTAKTDAQDAGEALAEKAYAGAKSRNASYNKSGSNYNAGYNFATGFGNGISSRSSWVYDKAYALAKQAVQAVNDAQDSGSPSKVMKEVGEWFGEGYVIGIESEYDEVERAAAKASALAVEAASADAVASISYDTAAQAATASAVLDALDRLNSTAGSRAESTGTVINQNFSTKVVRSDADLYTAAPIIYRNAMREASLA